MYDAVSFSSPAAREAPKPSPTTTTRAYRDAYKRRDVFYKDGSPKADHYLQFRVTLSDSLQAAIRGDALRLELTLLAVNDTGERVVVVGHGVEIQGCFD